MELKFSHVDVLVGNLEEACAYYARIFQARVSKTLVWERGGLHVRYAVVMFGHERFMLVQPLAGNLLDLMQAQGEGTIYRHCYATPDIGVAYDELVAAGVQPEDENGRPLAREQLDSPSGARILWLPKRFGHFSIELIDAGELDRFIDEAFDTSPPGDSLQQLPAGAFSSSVAGEEDPGAGLGSVDDIRGTLGAGPH